MNRRTALAILVFALVLAGWTGAEESDGFFTEFDPRIIGADVRVGYRFDLLPVGLTQVSGLVGGAWGGEAYYRYDDDSFVEPGDSGPTNVAFNRVNVRWDVGAGQDTAASGSLSISPFVYYRGFRNFPLDDESEEELFLDSPRSDAGGILSNGVLAGVFVDSVVADENYAVERGVYAEASVGFSPRWLLNDIVGASDFGRVNVTAKGFLPVAAVGAAADPVLGAYLAGFYAIDYLYGPTIPHAAASTVGGLNPRFGVGGAVRGVDSQRFDASFKTIANVEARVTFPGVLDPYLVPGIVVYLDGAYFSDLRELSPNTSEHSGYAATSGAGVSVDFFGIATLVFYTQYYLTGSTVARNSPWTPFALGFGYHF